MIEEYSHVKTLVEKEGFPKGTVGLVVSLYSTGPACEVEIFDKKGNTLDVVTYLFSELEIIDDINKN